jgi:hypothetical protein
MNHVTCTFEGNQVKIYRNDKLIGFVTEVSGEPMITVFADINHLQTFTFNDIAIIQDNWNVFSGLRGSKR